MPDVTHSGYFTTDDEQPERILEETSLQYLRGDSSTEDSADKDNVDHKICEDAVEDTVGDWYGDLDCDALPPNAKLYMRHSVSRVFHVPVDETGNFSHVADQFRFQTKSLKRCRNFCTQFASSVLRCFGSIYKLDSSMHFRSCRCTACDFLEFGRIKDGKPKFGAQICVHVSLKISASFLVPVLFCTHPKQCDCSQKNRREKGQTLFCACGRQFRFQTKSFKRYWKFCTQFANSVLRCFRSICKLSSSMHFRSCRCTAYDHWSSAK